MNTVHVIVWYSGKRDKYRITTSLVCICDSHLAATQQLQKLTPPTNGYYRIEPWSVLTVDTGVPNPPWQGKAKATNRKTSSTSRRK